MLQDRYNLSVPSTLLRVFRLPTMRQIQRLTPTELALGARGPRFESGCPDQRWPQAKRVGHEVPLVTGTCEYS
jgi:hypothetical protein